MPSLFVLPKQVPLSSAAGLLAGAKLLFSTTGSSTPQNTYTDIALTTPSANPVIADANGVFAPVYLDPSLPNYRVILKTSADVVLYTVDDVPSNQNTAQQFRLKAAAPDLLFEETDASAGNKKWRFHVNGEVLTIDLGNDAESVWTNLVTIPRTGVWTFATGLLNLGLFAVVTGNTGSFTGTLTGVSGTVTGTIFFSRTGTKITLYATAALIGVSTSTAVTITGVPAAIWPASSRIVPCTVRDNSVSNVAGAVKIQTSTLTFYKLSTATYDAAAFTAANNKGIDAEWSATYDIGGAPF